MLKLPKRLESLSRVTRDYVQMMAIIFRRAIYNIFYDNILEVTKTEVLNLIENSTHLILAYTLNYYRFMKVNGNQHLAAWMQFGRQETKRLIEKFPSIHNYIEKMTDPNSAHDPDNEIEDSVTRYRIRFLNNMQTTTPNFAVRREYQRIYLSQPK